MTGFNDWSYNEAMEMTLTITATEFKAKCLELLDRVAETGVSIQITKRGKVVAELVSPALGAAPGFAKGQMKIVGDIISPLDVGWEALSTELKMVAEERKTYGD